MPRPRNTPERLWSLVQKGEPDECWRWLGPKNAQGYGRVEIDNRGFYAHRLIYDLAFPGIIAREGPADRNAYGFLRHSCDNPSCCNPSHLTPGTHADNMRDKVERGRQHTFVSTESPRAKLTADDVRQIRAHKANGAASRALALLYEVSLSTIKFAINGRHYSDVR